MTEIAVLGLVIVVLGAVALIVIAGILAILTFLVLWIAGKVMH